MSEAKEPLFEVKGLEVEFETDSGPARAVRGVDFTVNRGETVALVGESGCGKSVTALATMGLLPNSARVRGSVRIGGKELIGLPEPELRRVRGGEIAMVFQEPMTSLNPVFRIGQQIAEVLVLHRGLDERAARREAIELLARVGIPLPERRVDQYPHELSGGMKQRVMIAMAIAGRPRLLIADEPTTALDVTIQAQILELLQSLRRDHDMAMLMITHDLGIVAHFAERVNVMYAGKLVESSRVVDLFDAPLHPYTRALLGALPRPGRSRERLEAIPGRVPPPDRMPRGCPFAPRCKLSMPVCAERMPELAERAPEHRAACFALDEPRAAGT
ncbi:MAG: ABC transporter ATP-binding protein [Pseudomonadota bacterium]|nr:MAG: dipeptide ABC transporter ATP-binding protein DppD [Pseudomonadota bacterium]